MLVSSEITRHYHSIIACSRHIYLSVILLAHAVRGESHIQPNASGEVATIVSTFYKRFCRSLYEQIVALIQSRAWNFTNNKHLKLVDAIKAGFIFHPKPGDNCSEKIVKQMHVLWMMLLKQ